MRQCSEVVLQKPQPGLCALLTLNRGEPAKAIDMLLTARSQHFREQGELLDAAAGRPPDRTMMAEIMKRHGAVPAVAQANVTAL
jgi:hypothetical protein